MSWSVKLVNLRNVSLYVHLTFALLILGLLATPLLTGDPNFSFLWNLVFVLGVVFSLVLHEYGHAMVAAYCGLSAGKVVLYPTGGIITYDMPPESPRQELLISLAGPLVSLVLAALCWLLSHDSTVAGSLQRANVSVAQENFFSMLGISNFLLAVINFTPVLPLDGGRIMRALLTTRYGYLQATSVTAAIGKVFSALMITVGLGLLNMFFISAGIFILWLNWSDKPYSQLEELVKGIQVKDALIHDFNSLDAAETVREVASVLQHNHSKFFLVMDRGMPVGTLNRLDVVRAMAELRYDQCITELMSGPPESLLADAPARSVVRKLSAHGERLYSVVDGGRFLGVINFQHLIEYLLLLKSGSKEFGKANSIGSLI